MAIIDKKFKIVLIAAVSIVLLIGIVSTVYILNTSRIGLQKNKAAVGGNIIISLSPTNITAPPNNDFSTSVNLKPASSITIQGYSIHLAFNTNKIKVKDISYKIGIANSIGDTNSTLTTVNEKGIINLVGLISDTSGKIINSDSLNEAVNLTFTSKSASQSIIQLDTSNQSTVTQIPDVGSPFNLNCILEESVKINNGITITDTLIPTSDITTPIITPSDTPIPAVSSTIPDTSIQISPSPINTTSPEITDNIINTIFASSPPVILSPTNIFTKTPITIVYKAPQNIYIIDTSTQDIPTINYSKPTIVGTNPSTNYFTLDSTNYPVSIVNNKWSYTFTTSITNGSHTISLYTVDGALISTKTFIISSQLPNTGILEDIIFPTLLSFLLLFLSGVIYFRVNKQVLR